MSGAKSRRKRKIAIVSSDLTTPDGKIDHKQVQPQSATSHTDKRGMFLICCHLAVTPDLRRVLGTVTSPRRSKRATNKRNLREMSDDEGVLFDFRPSPAKKPRTRVVPNTSKEVVKVRPVEDSRAEDKHSVQTNDSPIPKGKISTIPGGCDVICLFISVVHIIHFRFITNGYASRCKFLAQSQAFA